MSEMNPLKAQVMSLPELLKAQYEDLESKTRSILSTPEIYSLQHVILTGCGDSWAAVMAMKYAFEEFTGLRCETVRTLDLARYYPSKRLGGAPMDPLVIGVSNSGKVARMAEAMERATSHGAFTLAVTGNGDSPLAQASSRILKLDVPPFASAPGTRSYMVSLLALYLLAVRIAEVRGRMSMDRARTLRKEIPALADELGRMLEGIDSSVMEVAGQWKSMHGFDFVGGGVDEATAFFGMAKVFEATGHYANYINVEEWLHLDFFLTDRQNIGTVLIASADNAAASRIREVLGYMKQLGRPLLLISDVPAGEFGVECPCVIVPKTLHWTAFSMMSFIPICLLMGYVQEAVGQKAGRGCEGPWSFSKGARCVRESEKVII